MLILPLQHLWNFIFDNLRQHFITSAVLFHCWSSMDNKYSLLKLLSSHNSGYVQFSELSGLPIEYLNHTRPQLGVFLDMQCPLAQQFLNKVSQNHLFTQRQHWLIYDSKANLSYMQQLFEPLNMSVDADVTYFQPIYLSTAAAVNYSDFLLYDVYNNGKENDGKLNITVDRAVQCNAVDCQLLEYRSSMHRRTKYGQRDRQQDITLRVATVVTKRSLNISKAELLEFLLSPASSNVDSIARFGFQLTHLLQEQLGCNFDLLFMDHWSSNETIGGAIGALIARDADLVSTPFAATHERFPYLRPLLETGAFLSVCMFRTPRNSGIEYGVFLEPFSAIVWQCFFIILAIAALILWLIFAVEQKKLQRCLKHVPSLLSTALVAFGSACVQSTDLIPTSSGGRMAYFSLSLITFVVYNYYTSAVVSSLLSSQVKSKIKTLGQVADSSLDVGLEPLPFTMSYLNSSTHPDVRRFVQHKISGKPNPQKVWMSVEEGVKRVRDHPGFTFVIEASSAYPIVEKYFTQQEICDLNEVLLRPERSLYSHLHRNSPYRELIRLRLMRQLETGLYLKHRRYWVQSKLNCFSKNYVINVGMEYVAPLFIMLLIAYLLVLFVFGCEVFWARKCRKEQSAHRLVTKQVQ